MSEGVLVDYNDGVAHVRLNWPEKKNALNAAMLRHFVGCRSHSKRPAGACGSAFR